MKPEEKALRKFFRIKKNDNVPMVGWLDSTREHIFEFMGQHGGYLFGAEIGVRQGSNAKKMFELIPNLSLFCIDPWEGFSNTTTEEKASKHYKRFIKNMNGLNYKEMKMTSMEAINQFKDRSLDFVYIDGLHDFDNVMADIIFWTPKVRKGGIVSGHDYFENYQFGVVEAVRAYTRAHNINRWYITKKEKYASWFWINE